MAATKTIQSIYTDGACSGNPGPGGWATVVYFSDGSVHEMGGAASQTTNNRMEMQAAIEALEFLLAAAPSDSIALYTDSEYVKNGVTQWLKGWKQKGWKTATGKPVLNQDLWRVLDALQEKLAQQGTDVQWRYVKGHSGDRGNDRCDEIARAFALGNSPSLQQGWSPNSVEAMPMVASGESSEFDTPITHADASETLQSSHKLSASAVDANPDMVDSTIPDGTDLQSEKSEVPREVKVAQLRNVVDTLHMADEIARQGYLITSSELADLMDVNASAVTSRGDNWVWRNWVISRVRREGNQILWQLERVD
ncbi:ribonuclease HI [Leptolyngbya sp. NK1-12]|uniref:Ribonuclease H n=1 Tax=Leptolyngbya sp. NK1-12 TaxID=2547451 RepID=A0AA96WFS3_9CYAN|nr:ribonuclease HI [Leptolyngbya sp. NK1-12]WNZ24424.1 ribonuclease HI [Leptolyngbya sp. NK1-12]